MPCPDKFIKGCAGKVQHKTYLSAEYAKGENRNASLSTIYKCKYCGFFHVGTSKKEKRKLKIKPKGDGEEHKRKHRRFKY